MWCGKGYIKNASRRKGPRDIALQRRSLFWGLKLTRYRHCSVDLIDPLQKSRHLDSLNGLLLQLQIAEGRVIVGTAPQRPVIFAFALPDRQVIDAGNAQPHQPMLIEFPVLVAIAAKPIAAVVVPFVSEANRDPVIAERPNLLDEAVVKLAIPL